MMPGSRSFLRVSFEDGVLVHLSQVALGESKISEVNQKVSLIVTVLGNQSVLGTLSHENYPHLSLNLNFAEEFELSHDWQFGSVHISGYTIASGKGSFPLRYELGVWNDQVNEKYVAMGLHEKWVGAVTLGFMVETPSFLETTVIPRILNGESGYSSCDHGIDRMLTYTLPMVHLLEGEEAGVSALIITSLRWMSRHLEGKLEFISQKTKRFDVVKGGNGWESHASRVWTKPQVVVGTPTVLKNLLQIRPETELFSNVKMVIWEEDWDLAERFAEDMLLIYDKLPANAFQDLRFSCRKAPANLLSEDLGFVFNGECIE